MMNLRIIKHVLSERATCGSSFEIHNSEYLVSSMSFFTHSFFSLAKLLLISILPSIDIDSS